MCLAIRYKIIAYLNGTHEVFYSSSFMLANKKKEALYSLGYSFVSIKQISLTEI